MVVAGHRRVGQKSAKLWVKPEGCGFICAQSSLSNSYIRDAQFCEPAWQELAGCLGLLVWWSRLLEEQPCVQWTQTIFSKPFQPPLHALPLCLSRIVCQRPAKEEGALGFQGLPIRCMFSNISVEYFFNHRI